MSRTRKREKRGRIPSSWVEPPQRATSDMMRREGYPDALPGGYLVPGQELRFANIINGLEFSGGTGPSGPLLLIPGGTLLCRPAGTLLDCPLQANFSAIPGSSRSFYRLGKLFRWSAVLKGDEAGKLGPILENVMAAFAKAGVQVMACQGNLFQGAKSAAFVAFPEIFFLRFHGHWPSRARKYGGRSRPPYFADFLKGLLGFCYI